MWAHKYRSMNTENRGYPPHYTTIDLHMIMDGTLVPKPAPDRDMIWLVLFFARYIPFHAQNHC